ncbi:MAG TPA: restriction endonuclease subunit S [Candidatus Jorgensenbacteria bacterium]|nr:restriction endonuclease subunit S [Candidatus Jorgensenbacteria bacterium]
MPKTKSQPENWRRVRLGEVIFINPDSIGKDFSFQQILYTDISSVGEGTAEDPVELHLSEAPSRARRLIKSEDTILSTVRPNRRSFLYIKNPEKNRLVSTGFAVLRASDQIDSRFLYYFISNQSFTDYLSLHAKGATYPAVDADIITGADISLPELNEQKKISYVLSTYDNLIENNTKRIKILEKMAQAMYKEWFVYFRFPGHEKVKMVDSKTDLGEIPEGWEVKKLPEVFDFLEGPGIRNWQYTPTGCPFINIRLIQNNDININSANFISEEEANGKYKHFQLQERDMVVSTSGTLGRSAIVRKEHLPLILNTSVIRFRPIDGRSYAFMYQFLNADYFQNKILSMASGSAQPNFGPMHLKQIELLVPSRNVLNAFNNLVGPIYGGMIVYFAENQRLRQARDLLLPKLVGGEIRI